MIDRQHIESLLKANGVPPTAPDEEIRSVLISARWNHNDVDTALMVLKENTATQLIHVDTLHKVFHSDERLSPADISALLGIKVSLSKDDVSTLAVRRRRTEKMQTLIAIILALSIVFLGMILFMYKERIGVFYDPPTTLPTLVR